MNMKRLLTLVAFFATLHTSAQQVNPVPDYVFRNQMSVGRGTVTDTAAYFSIGPRYGATKGFMPPIVGDTATFSSGKRNGLLIFSVQKNKFLYWDSVRVQWSDMAGSSGAYIVAGDTSAMLAPYLRKVDTTSMLTAYLRKGDTTAMLSPYYRSATASAALALKLNISDTSSMLGNYIRHAGYGLTKSGQSFLVDTLNIATRAWRQKGLDSLAALEVSGSGTTNYVPKFTAGSTIGNSQIFDNGTNVGIGTASPLTLLHINGSSATAVQSFIRNANGGTNSASELVFGTWSGAIPTGSGNPGPSAKISAVNVNSTNASTDLTFTTYTGGGTPGSAERMRITSAGNVGIGITDPESYLTGGRQLVVANTSGAAGMTIRTSNTGDGSIFFSDGTTGDETYRGYVQYIHASDALRFGTSATERLRIFANGRVFVGASPTDAGYQLDINGTLRSVNGANFATTSGNVGIGTASPLQLFTVKVNTSETVAIQDQAGFGGLVFKHITTSAFRDGTIDAANLYLQSQSGGEVRINTTTDAGDYKLQVSGNIYNTGAAVLAATSGNVGIGVTPTSVLHMRSSSATFTIDDSGDGTSKISFRPSAASYAERAFLSVNYGTAEMRLAAGASGGAYFQSFYTNGTERARFNSAGEFIIDASGTDAGDYKLQVVGNARVGTGKLDIASNTTFGLGVARSGTSEVAGQIYNSNGILYFGAESSAGGQIFSGSSAYAGVIGTGANYPLQFAVNNITRGGFSTSGNLLLGFTTDSYFLKLQVNGSIFSNNQFFGQGVNAQLSIDSSTNISPIYVSNQSLTGSSAQGLFYGSTTWNTTGNPSLIDLAITNTASGSDANYIKISDGSNIFRVTKAAEVVTAAPTGGSIRKWKLGEAATVSPTSPNRTIRVEIDGTVYYLHAKTTND